MVCMATVDITVAITHAHQSNHHNIQFRLAAMCMIQAVDLVTVHLV